MPQSQVVDGFHEKVTFILNDVAEIVLNWNLGKISDEAAMNKINKAFAKQNLYSKNYKHRLI